MACRPRPRCRLRRRPAPQPAALPSRGFLRDAAVISAGVVGGSLLVKGVDALFDPPDTGGASDIGIDGWL